MCRSMLKPLPPSMCLWSSLFYFLYLPSHSGSWYLIQILICTTTMSIFFFFRAIQHHQLSGYTLPYFHYSCSYDSFFLPLSWHTAKFSWFHAQPKFLQVSPKLESPLRRAQQSSFYGPQALQMSTTISVPCSALKSNTLLWCPENRTELCQRVSSRVSLCDLGTISERVVP